MATKKLTDAALMPAPNVQFDASPECVGRMMNSDGKPDWTVTRVRLDAWNKGSHGGPGFEVAYETWSAGFGTVTIYQDADGKLNCDNEAMGRTFLKAVLSKLIDECELLDKKEGP